MQIIIFFRGYPQFNHFNTTVLQKIIAEEKYKEGNYPRMEQENNSMSKDKGLLGILEIQEKIKDFIKN